MNVGCGSSRTFRHFERVGLSEEMYKDGFQHITNVDISPTLIKQLQERYKEEAANMKCTIGSPQT